MKHFLMTAMVAASLLFTACGGTPGPTGATGPIGVTGPAGPSGPTGNANVQQYTFGSRTFSSSNIFAFYTVSTFTQAQLDASTILAFHELSTSTNAWYPTPGLNDDGSYVTVLAALINGSDLRVATTIRNLNGTPYTYSGSTITWTRFRVIVIPASSNVTLAKTSGVDLNNYESVRKYYNLPKAYGPLR